MTQSVVNFYGRSHVIEDMGSIPRALIGVVTDFSVAQRRAGSLVDNRSAAELNWRPDGKRWSILQCIEHLVLTNQLLLDAIKQALDGQAEAGAECGRIMPTRIWRILLAMTEPQVRLKGFAPRVLHPALVLDTDRTLTAFAASHERLRLLAAQCQGLDINRVRFRHPVMRLKMSVGEAFLLLVVHEQRHLRQAEVVAASLRA